MIKLKQERPLFYDFRSQVQTMKLKYFKDTDTLYLEFKNSNIVDAKDLDENTLLELDDQGNICAITLEHASERTDVNHLSTEGIAA